jgi:hypothetical protein
MAISDQTASQILRGLGAPDTQDMRNALKFWAGREGGSNSNPLNVGETMANVAAGVWYSPGIGGTVAAIKRFPGIYRAAVAGNADEFLNQVGLSGWAGTHYANQMLGVPNRGNETYHDTRSRMAQLYPGLKAKDWGVVTGPYLVRAFRKQYGGGGNGAILEAVASTSPAISQRSVTTKVIAIPQVKSRPVPAAAKALKTAAHYTSAIAVDRNYIHNLEKITSSETTSALQKQDARAGIATNTSKIATYAKKATAAVKSAASITKNANAAKSAKAIADSRIPATTKPSTSAKPATKTATKAKTTTPVSKNKSYAS